MTRNPHLPNVTDTKPTNILPNVTDTKPTNILPNVTTKPLPKPQPGPNQLPGYPWRPQLTFPQTLDLISKSGAPKPAWKGPV